jgi:putative nucleotidyltransferase with HDIG domain
MINILFVDDEPNILSGLQRMLRPMRHDWEMSFASGGAAAMEMVHDKNIDVIVSDMRMPGMDGAQLLQNIRKDFPQVVRIILSGYSEREMILRSVGTTHQFLSKPCDADSLRATVGRACALRDLLTSEKLRQLVSQMPTVPSMPILYEHLMKELERPEPRMREIGAIVKQDIGMTVKILQIVNSAFFGLRRTISDAAEALTFLGLDTITSLTLSIGVFSQFEGKEAIRRKLNEIWNHSLAVGTLAKKVAGKKHLEMASDAFAAGMLHDIGEVVLAANLPEKFLEVEKLMKEEGLNKCDAERVVFEASHAEVGAYLLGLWGLPNQVVEAVAFHHEPGKYDSSKFSALTAVHVANALHRSARTARSDDSPGSSDGIDQAYLESLGLQGEVELWRAVATDLPEEIEEGK